MQRILIAFMILAVPLLALTAAFGRAQEETGVGFLPPVRARDYTGTAALLNYQECLSASEGQDSSASWGASSMFMMSTASLGSPSSLSTSSAASSNVALPAEDFCFFAAEQTPQWVAGPAAFRTQNATLRPTVSLTMPGGQQNITVRNRGIAVSTNEYPSGVRIDFAWKWTGGRVEGALQDILAIALRTDGRQGQRWSHEIDRGIMVRLAGHGANQEIQVVERAGGMNTVIAHKRIILLPNTTYNVTIVDSGGVIDVKVNDDFIRTQPSLPIGAFRKVAIYNREPSVGVSQESVLTNVVINPVGP